MPPASVNGAAATTLKQKLLLIITSIGLCLVAAELISRLTIPYIRGTHQHPSSIWRDDFIREDRIGQYHEQLGWVLKPNETTTHKSWEFEYNLTTNSRGLRDEEASYERDSGRPRLLLLGDSFAMGYGIDKPHALEAVLEDLLDAEVINLSVSGYGTDQQLLSYEGEGVKYEADVVLLAFTIDNDVINNAMPSQYRKNKPYFTLREEELVLAGVPVPRREFPDASPAPEDSILVRFPVHDFLDAHSALYAFVFDRLSQILWFRDRWVDSGLVFTQVDLFYPSQMGMLKRQTSPSDNAWRLTLKLLEQFQRRVLENGSELILILVPSNLQIDLGAYERVIASRRLDPDRFDADHPNRILREFATSRSLRLIDLSGALRASAESGRSPYFKRNPHWNRVGHHIAASTIAHELANLEIFNP